MRSSTTIIGRLRLSIVDLDGSLRAIRRPILRCKEHDNLRISRLPDWNSQWTVRLDGEITFPGDYRIRQGETLRQLLDRAGGLTDRGVSGRRDLSAGIAAKARARANSTDLANRVQADITSLSLEERGGDSADSLRTGQCVVAATAPNTSCRATGDRPRQIVASGQEQSTTLDLELRDGDQVACAQATRIQ